MVTINLYMHESFVILLMAVLLFILVKTIIELIP